MEADSSAHQSISGLKVAMSKLGHLEAEEMENSEHFSTRESRNW